MTPLHPRNALRQALIVLSLGMANAPARAQTLGLAPSHDISAWRIVGALLLCCALGFAGALALRFRMQGRGLPAKRINAGDWRQLIAGFSLKTKPASGGGERLQLVGTVRLGYQVDVNLLDCDGKAIVIVTSPHGAFVANADAPDRAGKAS